MSLEVYAPRAREPPSGAEASSPPLMDGTVALQVFRERGTAAAARTSCSGAYALIGVFPYRFTAPFEGRGGLSVLAYPRLWLLLAIFIVGVYFSWRQAPSSP